MSGPLIIRHAPVYYPRYYEGWRYDVGPYYAPPYYAQPYYTPRYYRHPRGPSVVIDIDLPPIVIL